MANRPRAFRLTDDEHALLDNLKNEMNAHSSAVVSEADVVRAGLVALRTLMDDGYEFGLTGRYAALRRSPQGKTVTFYRLAKNGGLVLAGEAQWTEAPDDEQPIKPKANKENAKT